MECQQNTKGYLLTKNNKRIKHLKWSFFVAMTTWRQPIEIRTEIEPIGAQEESQRSFLLLK